ncbi:hypothetical protein K435DRAFT_852353 [Dendrothele bispora CBS 962.96]|uniref:Uncharacterized protein n=1 Tax=Dendrothele bispora (strain CBS 962.96) TaxID=1314807 RepID=A0A4S8MK19_DENBC|nr:hypothetical protein K435DRAFT_852353 [Dendrothele bispora CBS 962.96]
MPSALRFCQRLHALDSNLPRLTEDFLQSIHPPRTPLHVVSNNPAHRALYLMLTKIWPAEKLEKVFVCSADSNGCIIHHLVSINVHGQLKATCELCDIDESLPVLSVWEWAVLQDGLRRWEAQEAILRRAIDLTGEDGPPTSIPNSGDHSPVPLQFLRSILHPSTPFWVRTDDEGLKAIYNIITYLHPERELQTAVCPHSPAGCIAFHVVKVHQGGRLYAECDRCDVKSHCHPLNANDYYQVQKAFLHWIDQDNEQIEEEMVNIRREITRDE